MKTYNQFNESVRDLMKPKSEEEILKSLSELSPIQKLKKGIDNNYISIFKKGIEEGANLKRANSYYDLLYGAVVHNQIEIAKLILENGIKFKDSDNLLSWAARDGNIDMVKLLLKYGANPNYADKFAMRLAADNDHFDIVKLLKQYEKIIK
jgi:ankyrin repeat protein